MIKKNIYDTIFIKLDWIRMKISGEDKENQIKIKIFDVPF